MKVLHGLLPSVPCLVKVKYLQRQDSQDSEYSTTHSFFTFFFFFGNLSFFTLSSFVHFYLLQNSQTKINIRGMYASVWNYYFTKLFSQFLTHGAFKVYLLLVKSTFIHKIIMKSNLLRTWKAAWEAISAKKSLLITRFKMSKYALSQLYHTALKALQSHECYTGIH